MGKRGSIAGFEVFYGFREGLRCFERSFKRIDPPESGEFWSVFVVFERIMRKIWFKNQVPGCFFQTSERERE
jgi:hypothetical protein